MRGEASSIAPGAIRSVILSFSTRVPLTNVPRGRRTIPPPAAAQASIAR
jgi:hypothetical protein